MRLRVAIILISVVTSLLTACASQACRGRLSPVNGPVTAPVPAAAPAEAS